MLTVAMPPVRQHAANSRCCAAWARRAVSSIAVVLVALVLAALSACDQRTAKSFNNTDVTGSSIGANGFSLVDHTGKTRTLQDYAGKIVYIFFGFTHCPDVCPTTMLEMGQVMKALGPRADDVQVLFITVDPERDTQELLAQYVPAFDPRFVGLRGTPEETARTAKDFKVFYQKTQSPGSDAYSVDHTAGGYVFDRSGQIRLFVRHGGGAEPLAEDIGKLLGEA